jgi:hypothetical protein
MARYRLFEQSIFRNITAPDLADFEVKESIDEYEYFSNVARLTANVAGLLLPQ